MLCFPRRKKKEARLRLEGKSSSLIIRASHLDVSHAFPLFLNQRANRTRKTQSHGKELERASSSTMPSQAICSTYPGLLLIGGLSASIQQARPRLHPPLLVKRKSPHPPNPRRRSNLPLKVKSILKSPEINERAYCLRTPRLLWVSSLRIRRSLRLRPSKDPLQARLPPKLPQLSQGEQLHSGTSLSSPT